MKKNYLSTLAGIILCQFLFSQTNHPIMHGGSNGSTIFCAPGDILQFYVNDPGEYLVTTSDGTVLDWSLANSGDMVAQHTIVGTETWANITLRIYNGPPPAQPYTFFPNLVTIQYDVTNNPEISVNSNLNSFSQTLGIPASEQSFTVSGTNLTNNITVTSPTNYEVSLSSGSGFASSVQVNQTSGLVPTTTIYVRLNAAAVGAYSGDITLTSGALSETVAVTGNTTQGTTGLNENNLTHLSIFPNPGSGMIILSVNQPTSAVFMSANGAILANLELNGETSIDVSSYASGVYFIRTTEGQTVKFIKE